MAWGGCHIKVSTGQERVNAGRLSIMGKYVDGLSRSITRSQSQKSACKDLKEMAKAQPFSLEATYTPISKRDCSRSAFRNAVTGPETCT